jgi:hypothetical protein
MWDTGGLRWPRGSSPAKVATLPGARSARQAFARSCWRNFAGFTPDSQGDPITKQRAVIRTLIQEGIGGNLRARGVLVGYLTKAGAPEETNDALASDEDQEILEDVWAASSSVGASMIPTRRTSRKTSKRSRPRPRGTKPAPSRAGPGG